MPMDLPPQMQERIVCSIAASVHYDVPANILLAIAEKEAGRPGQWVRNTNGTHDVGVMQFNTSYIKTLTAQYGITAEHVAVSGCYPYDLAAWRIHGHIANDTGDIWTKAANYHSRTPYYNSIYRADLMVRANKWANWLDDLLSGDTNKINAVLAAIPATKTVTVSEPQPIKKAAIVAANTNYVPRQIMAVSHSQDE